MPKGLPSGETRALTTQAAHVVQQRKRLGSPEQVIKLARGYTTQAIRKLAELMEGKAGTIRVLVPGSDGRTVEVDVEVTAAVQCKAAEILLDRAWGKAPQAVLIGSDNPDGNYGPTMLSIMDRILAIRQARVQAGQTTDLEASEQREVLDVETSPAGDPRDQI